MQVRQSAPSQGVPFWPLHRVQRGWRYHAPESLSGFLVVVLESGGLYMLCQGLQHFPTLYPPWPMGGVLLVLWPGLARSPTRPQTPAGPKLYSARISTRPGAQLGRVSTQLDQELSSAGGSTQLGRELNSARILARPGAQLSSARSSTRPLGWTWSGVLADLGPCLARVCHGQGGAYKCHVGT